MKKKKTQAPAPIVEEKPVKTAEKRSFKETALSYMGTVWIWIIVVILIASAVLVSMLAEQLQDRFGWEWDLTRNRVYSISEATKATLALLDRNIDIYTLYRTGSEDITITELLRRYEIDSKHIKVENVDPVSNPLFTQNYEDEGDDIAQSSIIVAMEGDKENFRVISAQNLYEYEMKDDQMYVTALVAEQRITSAIESLMGGRQPNAYFIEGHGEKTGTTLYYLESLLENDEYNVESYNLIYNEKTLEPEDDLLFFFAPQTDLTDEETEVLEEYFGAGGKAVFFCDIYLAGEHPNFSKVLGMFGLGLRQELVCETDTSRFLNSEVILTPLIVDHPATEMLREAGTYAVMPTCRPVTVTTKAGIENSPLYLTSDTSYGKLDTSLTTTAREDGDADGPFTLAAAAENTDTGARVALYGSIDFISTIEVARVAGNLAVYMGTVSWVDDRGDAVLVSSKSLVDPPLQISSTAAANVLMVVVIALIPIVVILFGVMVWRRRVRR